MLKTQIDQAQARYERAAKALQRYRDATSISDHTDAWSEFLYAVAGVYNRLTKASKNSGRSKAWDGRLTHVRRSDPLLRYLHHARNDEDHGLKDPLKPALTIRDEVAGIPVMFKITAGDQMPQTFPGDWEGPIGKHRTFHLVTVVDSRTNVAFEPPVEHLGKPLNDGSPAAVGELALKYLASVLAEARDMIVGG